MACVCRSPSRPAFLLDFTLVWIQKWILFRLLGCASYCISILIFLVAEIFLVSPMSLRELGASQTGPFFQLERMMRPVSSGAGRAALRPQRSNSKPPPKDIEGGCQFLFTRRKPFSLMASRDLFLEQCFSSNGYVQGNELGRGFCKGSLGKLPRGPRFRPGREWAQKKRQG